jgi:hypothetical protein
MSHYFSVACEIKSRNECSQLQFTTAIPKIVAVAIQFDFVVTASRPFTVTETTTLAFELFRTSRHREIKSKLHTLLCPK